MNATWVAVRFHSGSILMTSVTLFVIAFLALSAWRLVFTGLRRRRLVRASTARQDQQNNVLDPGLYNLGRPDRVMVAGDRFGNSTDDADSISRKNRAKTYLHRIVALTGATQSRNAYVLDVGKTRFHVGNRRVGRVKDLTDPESANDETCFYPTQEGMPKAEEIAIALLQLKNNPTLFDKWVLQNGQAFKADGQVFTRAR